MISSISTYHDIKIEQPFLCLGPSQGRLQAKTLTPCQFSMTHKVITILIRGTTDDRQSGDCGGNLIYNLLELGSEIPVARNSVFYWFIKSLLDVYIIERMMKSKTESLHRFRRLSTQVGSTFAVFPTLKTGTGARALFFNRLLVQLTICTRRVGEWKFW